MLPTKPDLSIVSGFFARSAPASAGGPQTPSPAGHKSPGFTRQEPKNMRRAHDLDPKTRAARTFWQGPKIAAGGSCIVTREDGSDKCAKVVSVDQCATTIGEVAFLTALDHPNVIRLIGVEYGPEYMCMQLEYYEITLTAYCGCRAHNRMQHCTCPPLRDHVSRGQFARGIASGLAYIHARGVIHADLKPDNIFVRVGDEHTAVIADFGAALLASSPMMRCDFQTPLYRAPETVPGTMPSPLMDMWSFGVILLELDGFRHNISAGRVLADYRADVVAAATESGCDVIAGCIRDVGTRICAEQAARMLGAQVDAAVIQIGDVGMAIRASLPASLSTRLALSGGLDDAVGSLTACLVGRACELTAKNVRDAMILSESTAGVVLRPRRRARGAHA